MAKKKITIQEQVKREWPITPSAKLIAEKLKMNRKNVQNVIHVLRKRGELQLPPVKLATDKFANKAKEMIDEAKRDLLTSAQRIEAKATERRSLVEQMNIGLIPDMTFERLHASIGVIIQAYEFGLISGKAGLAKALEFTRRCEDHYRRVGVKQP